MKSEYLLCYFLSFVDLQRILKNKQKNLSKLRDIALFKLTVMSLELRKFDNMIDRLMHYIKTNHSLRAKTISRKQRHTRYFLTNTIHKEVFHFLAEEIGHYIEATSQSKVEETQESIMNFIFKIVLSQNSLNTHSSKAQLKNESSANNLPGKSSGDRTIPEEKENPITLPNFNLRQTLMMMAEPEPEHMFFPGSYLKRASSNEANTLPYFRVHRNMNKMQMLPTTESNFEELEVPSSKRQLDFEIDFPKEGRDFSFDLPQDAKSELDSSISSKNSQKSEQKKKDHAHQANPTKLSLAEKSSLSAALSPRASFNPKRKLFTPLQTFSDVYHNYNKVDQIEEMLENYFDVNLDEVRGALVNQAPRGNRVQARDVEPTFSNCLLEYLEKKEIIEMEDIENFLDYKPSLMSDAPSREFEQRVVFVDREEEEDFLDLSQDESIDSQEFPIDSHNIFAGRSESVAGKIIEGGATDMRVHEVDSYLRFIGVSRSLTAG